MQSCCNKPTMDQTLAHQGVHLCGKPGNAFQLKGIDDKSCNPMWILLDYKSPIVLVGMNSTI